VTWKVGMTVLFWFPLKYWPLKNESIIINVDIDIDDILMEVFCILLLSGISNEIVIIDDG
jgi:hypothetical protein